MRIILASASPRRRELLAQMGMEFEVCPSQGEEKITEVLPERAVMELAQQKAAEIAVKTEGDAWILGADTVVVYDQKILGRTSVCVRFHLIFLFDHYFRFNASFGIFINPLADR